MSWLLALIALVTVPASAVAMRKIGKRAQPQFINQWKHTGRLNGHIEEMYTGHALVKAFGQREESAATFTEQNEALYQASFRAQFISGTIQPRDDVHRQPELRAGGRRRRPAGRVRRRSPSAT